MVGRMVFQMAKRPKLVLAAETVAGLTLLRAEVAAPDGLKEDRLERRVDRAAAQLARRGVRRVLAEEEFPWWPVLAARGLGPVEIGPLAQAMAAPLILSALRRQGAAAENATVALAGRRVSRPMFRAAEELRGAVRRLAVAAPEGGEALANYLRAQFGMPVLGAEGARAAQVTACFSPDAGERHGTVLELWGAMPKLGGLGLTCALELPGGQAEKLRFLTLLWENGRIDTGEIAVI